MALSVLTHDRWHDSGPYAQRAERIREWIDGLEGGVWPTDHWGVCAELRTDRLLDA